MLTGKARGRTLECVIVIVVSIGRKSEVLFLSLSLSLSRARVLLAFFSVAADGRQCAEEETDGDAT